MPQAIERLLATPMIRPRFPRMRPEASGICPRSAGRIRPTPNDIGPPDLQAAQAAGRTGPKSSHVLARIVGLGFAPLAHQFLELVVMAFEQHDADTGQEI